jgi:hypothetical protein
MVRTTLGPRGMDKLVADGRKVTISNDGATIMRLLEIEHPAAKTLVDISMSQVSKKCSLEFSLVVSLPPPKLDLLLKKTMPHTPFRMPRLEMVLHQ